MTSKEFGKILQDKLTSEYGVELNVASNQQIYRSLALICRQMMSENHKKFQSKAIGTGTKQVYYLCMEFLMGRSLKNNLYNLNLTDVFASVLADYGVKLENLYECEPDAGLGNGGLGSTNTVSSSRSSLTAGRPSFRTFGFRAVKYGLSPTKRAHLRFALRAT